jgi:hypothetical protein
MVSYLAELWTVWAWHLLTHLLFPIFTSIG